MKQTKQSNTADQILFYEPAVRWEEALPLGNGSLGAMLYGDVGAEHIQLNEESVWYGSYVDRNNPDAATHLEELRSAILSGDVNRANELANHTLAGTPQSMRPYQTLGDLTIYGQSGRVSNYERKLLLSEAVHFVTYEQEGSHYTREAFISAPAHAMVMRYQTDAPEGLTLSMLLQRGRYYDYAGKADDSTIMMGGSLGNGSSFCAMLRAKALDGEVLVQGEQLLIRHSHEVIFYLSAATTYRKKNPEKYLTKVLDKVSETAFEHLRSRHLSEYKRYYNRMKLHIAVDDKRTNGETIERYFNFGRYLMISGSRPGTLPLTLQGLWNKDFTPAWDSKYTININTEMNYWPAESCNLSECHTALLDHIARMVEHGKETAKKMYHCSGMVAHHNTDIWGDTAVQDIWLPASYWVMGAAWLCTHQWTHYLYTQDEAFLREAYPIMKEAAKFFLDYLIEDGGYLVTCPSVSPENTYILPDGQQACLTSGSTMDNQIIRDLMTQCIKAAELLKLQDEYTERFQNVLDRLIPNQIGKYGQLMEWREDYEEAERGHRHISHLYGLYPSHQITPDKTPELAKAAATTLERRLANGGGHTGWSRAWIMNMYGRLGNGNAVYENLLQLFEKSTLPNLFDNHPPFQIDGNFGAIAAIAEMLVQSSEERTILLPALPDCFSAGNVKGIRIIGNAVISLSWKNHRLNRCTVTAYDQLRTILVYREKHIELYLNAGETKNITTELRSER